MNDDNKLTMVVTLAGIAAILVIVCFLVYQDKATEREAIKAGLIQKKEGFSAPIWVKPETKSTQP